MKRVGTVGEGGGGGFIYSRHLRETQPVPTAHPLPAHSPPHHYWRPVTARSAENTCALTDDCRHVAYRL
uniref:Uncharacterized protein n=1 Tax=Knipowitschia caucasica TaxID=637954 RepID=A0AAV2JYA3_KNICA